MFNLSCGDTVLLSAGEWRALSQLLPGVSDPTLTAMTLGGDVTPGEALACLDVTLALQANGDETVHRLLDRAIDRLAAAHPELGVPSA